MAVAAAAASARTFIRQLCLLTMFSRTVGVAEVRIGALVPIFRASTGQKDTSGVRRFSSFYMAVSEINNKSDGVDDWLLPNTRLSFALRDSKRDDSAAFFGALALTREVFSGEGCSAIVGAASSGPSEAAAVVASRLQTPQISYSSTSPLLSDGLAYPYFLRTCPSDAFQARAIVDVRLHSNFVRLGCSAVLTACSPPAA